MIWLWRLALTAYLLLLPVGALLPAGSSGSFRVNDKLLHAGAFFGLALLADLALPGRRYDWANLLALFTLGLLIEAVQYPTGYRDASLADLAADAAGLGLYGLVRGRWLGLVKTK
ncbi:hypothetical protein MIN45_P1044 [Methylomarinovum tepidoasis]|uniref:VanZ-like domain-containing protein n=1 Tax=Methylomarinovum tepidoasis TaxID=2840183 RepID=A0AAU9CVF1_9GAMM|nr:hypothetical protein [Methylomarinovum sp. IN45]BCX88675.1 hypothetical protein MIN45_P1044 [Methylomarinovum sp. IN45]